MTIRKAVEADFASVREVLSLFPDTIMQVHLPRPDEFFVAEHNGRIIGCCALEVYSQRLAEIRSLAVLPEHQGKGIGAGLVLKCVEEAKALDILEVLAITGATELFEKQGFAAFNKEKYALFKMLEA